MKSRSSGKGLVQGSYRVRTLCAEGVLWGRDQQVEECTEGGFEGVCKQMRVKVSLEECADS